MDRLQMSCEHVGLELRPKTIVKLSAVRTNEGSLFQTVGRSRSMRTDEQQCVLMKTVLTLGLT